MTFLVSRGTGEDRATPAREISRAAFLQPGHFSHECTNAAPAMMTELRLKNLRLSLKLIRPARPTQTAY